MITHDELNRVLRYDADTGVFKWSEGLDKRRRNNLVAGCVNGMGYLIIKIKKERYLAHRLAWFYQYGVYPKETIDHINGDPLDNRICNLREATRAENMLNKKIYKNNKSGFKGVYYRNGKYIAQARMNNKKFHLGVFDSAESAARAYSEFAKKNHGDFFRG